MIDIDASALLEIRARMSSAPYTDPTAFFGAYFPPGMMGSGELRETQPGVRRYAASASEAAGVPGLHGPIMDVQIHDRDTFTPEDVVDLDGLYFQIPVGLRPLLAGARLSFENQRFVLYAPDGNRIRLPGM